MRWWRPWAVLLLTGATCFSPGAGPLAGRRIVSPAPARLEMTVSVPPEDNFFGLTSLKSQMGDKVYIEMLEMASAAAKKVWEMQVKAAQAETKAAQAETKTAVAETQLEKANNRADKFKGKLEDAKRKELITRGFVDLRSILADILPTSKNEEAIETWLQSQKLTDRRHVRSAA